MDFNQYKDQALRTESSVNLEPIAPIAAHAILSAAALTGELADVLKRTIAYGAAFDLERFARAATALAQAATFIAWNAEAIAKNDAAAIDAAIAHPDAQPEVTAYMRSFNYTQVPGRGLHAVLGTIGEAGEQAEIFAAAIGGKPIDAVHIGEELADVRWYDALACSVFELDSNSVAEANINKLKVRYADKFTQDAALNRDLAAERVQLEAVATA